MMKAVFNCRPAQMDIGPLPQVEPYLIKLANKPLIEYWLDLCVELNIQDLIIIDYGLSKTAFAHLGSGANWGLKIEVIQSSTSERIPDLCLEHKNFMDEDILFFDGFFFPFFDRHVVEPLIYDETGTLFFAGTDLRATSHSLWLLPLNCIQALQEAKSRQETVQIWHSFLQKPLAGLSFEILNPLSLRQYFDLNMQILAHAEQFYLPGLKLDTGISAGDNSFIAKPGTYTAPIVIGNACSLSSDLDLQAVILHDQVRLVGPVRLSRCMVWGPAYLGLIELEDCIIFQDKVIEPSTGSQQPLAQPFRLLDIVSDTNKYQERLSQQRAISQILLKRRKLMFMLLKHLIKPQTQSYYLNAKGETIQIQLYLRPEKPSFGQDLFFRRGLHWVPYLKAVLTHDLFLVGNCLLPTEAEYLELIQALPVYAPGIFSHSRHYPLDSLEFFFEELQYSQRLYDDWDESILAIGLDSLTPISYSITSMKSMKNNPD